MAFAEVAPTRLEKNPSFSRFALAVRLLRVCTFLSLWTFTFSANAEPRQLISGHIPKAVKNLRLQPSGQLATNAHLSISIGLPLRNPEALSNLVAQLYDPSSTNYRRFLKPAEFAERFGPTQDDYNKVATFAAAHGLTIPRTHSSRALLTVNGSVPDIEKTFHTKLRTYRHPKEARNFFAPDVEPSIDLSVPVVSIHGLDDYSRPQPMNIVLPKQTSQAIKPAAGAASGSYAGNDFRAAYVPAVTLTGAGQSVALVEFDGYYASDIAEYETEWNLPAVPLTNIYLDNWTSSSIPGVNDIEVALDIEMAASMAPGLDQILVYEGDDPDNVLTQIADDNLARQISASWTFDITPNTPGIFLRFAAQGQTYFNASGDSGSYAGEIAPPVDQPYVISVGGTILDTTGPSGDWVSETVWNRNSNGTGTQAGGGGVSTTFILPDWQRGIDMAARGGSTTMHNVPDIAMVAENILILYGNGARTGAGGTSCSSPLWAAYMALVNQKATALGQPPLGFINPLLYTIGRSANYASLFHDTTTGNNTNQNNPTQFFAVTGYDLCTGWGSPTAGLIDALIAAPPTILQQPANQSTAVGGSATFSVAASSSFPFFYQWTLNDGNIAGATTETLTIFPVRAADAGMYQVKITNSVGSVKSMVATLSVTGTPVLLSIPPLSNLYTNGAFTFQLAGLTGQGTIVIQSSSNLVNWSPIFTNQPGFGQVQFTDTNAGNFPRRFYRAVIQ